MVKISIIIPIYGVERHIERCLLSVMRQDYEGAIECILVDDCGTDNSVSVAKSVLSNYTGNISFIWLHHSKNKGLSGARNTGLKAATGDYIFYLDSDDEILPYAISSLVTFVYKYTGVDVVYGDWYVSVKYNCLQNKQGLPEYIDNRHEICRHVLAYDMSMTAQNKLLRKKFLLDYNLFFLENVIHEDLHFNCRLANTAHSIAISYIPTYVYYLNPNGITSSYGLKDITSVYLLVTDLLDNCSVYYKALNCYYISDVLIGSYIHCESHELIEKGRTLLQRLCSEAKKNRHWLLYLYISYVLKKSPAKLKRQFQSPVFQKMKNLLRRITFNRF